MIASVLTEGLGAGDVGFEAEAKAVPALGGAGNSHGPSVQDR